MKTLGLDLGNRTVGIAISDAMGFLARPLETYRFPEQRFSMARDYIVELVRKEQIKTIVLGYPKHMNGSVGEQGQISEQFQAMLAEKLDIPIHLWDERLSSKLASTMMKDQQLSRQKRQSSIDAMAAVVILQGYLDRNQ